MGFRRSLRCCLSGANAPAEIWHKNLRGFYLQRNAVYPHARPCAGKFCAVFAGFVGDLSAPVRKALEYRQPASTFNAVRGPVRWFLLVRIRCAAVGPSLRAYVFLLQYRRRFDCLYILRQYRRQYTHTKTMKKLISEAVRQGLVQNSRQAEDAFLILGSCAGCLFIMAVGFLIELAI